MVKSAVTMLIIKKRRQWQEEHGFTPQRINEGSCFAFAKDVFDVLPGAKIAGQNVNGQGHTFIEFDGMFYDAEHSFGVSDWKNLPFFRRISAQKRTTELAARSRHSEPLSSFTTFCKNNPALRFWQAARAWSGVPFILASETGPHDPASFSLTDVQDTFYWEGRDG